MDYPPEPWDLHGHGCASLWAVRSTPPLPDGVRPVRVLGRSLVVTGFVAYLPGSLLPYNELLAAVLVRRGWRLGLTITHIWVDSEPSKAGARAMWGIPKELADLDVTRLSGDAEGIAAARLVPKGATLPVKAALPLWQSLGGRTTRTPFRASGRAAATRLEWRFAAKGPLGWLLPHRPLLGVVIPEFRMRFGSDRAGDRAAGRG